LIDTQGGKLKTAKCKLLLQSIIYKFKFKFKKRRSTVRPWPCADRRKQCKH